MEATSLKEIYASINKDASTVYVVPLIRYSHKKSDYLYLLYKDLIENSELNIQSISVFNHFKLLAGIITNRNAILHYHWLEFQDFKSLLGMPWKITCIYLFYLLGGKIVWTLHNEFPHDQQYLSLHSYLHKKMAKWAQVLHVHCYSAIEIMQHRLDTPKAKFRIVPHPEFPSKPVEKEKALSLLNEQYNCHLDENTPTLLMFGNISRYKQIEKVAKIVTELIPECKLLVVGPIKKGNLQLYRELESYEKQNHRVRIIPRFIQEDHVSWFYSASDICVFNYREILSSGGYHMAKAYNKTIIAPNLGCLSEEANHPNVYLFDTPSEFKELLDQQIKAASNV